jgi:DNA helicase-2/ATP-dependent DNA helicase PcrA
MNKQYQKKEEAPKPTIEPPKNLTKITKATNGSAILSTDLKSLAVGMQVLHEKFDKGKVMAVEGIGENKIATIFFDGIGNKKIMLKFAKLQIVE